MKSMIGALALCLVSAHTCFPQELPDSLTVQSAVQWVLEHHPEVREASERLAASAARVEGSRSFLYPTVDAVASYTRIGPVAELFFPGLGNFLLYPENNYDGHFSARQTVFDFGKRSSSVDVAQSAVQTATDDIDLVRANLAFQTIRTFYSMLFLQQNLRVQNDQVEALHEHLLITQRKVQNNTATEFDVLTTQVRVATARSERIDAENELEKQEVQFRQLLGLSPGTPLRLKGDFTLRPVPLSADSLLAEAQRKRPELRMARDAERTAALQRESASLQDMPALKFNLAYGAKNGYIPNLDVLRGNWVAGASLEIPIFNGNRTSAMEQEATANELSAKEKTKDVERQVSAEVQQAIADVRANREKVQTSDLQVDQARQAFAMAGIRYDNGVSTNLDVIDAQTALAQAELLRLQALFRYVVSRYALERAVGGTLPK